MAKLLIMSHLPINERILSVSGFTISRFRDQFLVSFLRQNG